MSLDEKAGFISCSKAIWEELNLEVLYATDDMGLTQVGTRTALPKLYKADSKNTNRHR